MALINIKKFGISKISLIPTYSMVKYHILCLHWWIKWGTCFPDDLAQKYRKTTTLLAK